MKALYYRINSYLSIIKKDLKYGFPLPLHKKIKMWRSGFLAEKYTLYQLDKENSNLFLSDYHTSMARWINDPFIDILTNKYIFTEIVGNVITVPEMYGAIFSGIYYPKTDERNLIELIHKKNKIVVKGVTGGGGKFVFIVEYQDGDFKVNDKKRYSKEEFNVFVSELDNYIVTEFIVQGAFSSSLNKETVNTLRVVTLIDPKTKEPFIGRAVQRIGVNASKPMDNFTKGGVSAMINIDTGILSDTTSHPKTSRHIRYSKHPETGQQIEGIQIPNWDNVKEKILKAAACLPMLKVIGWDIVLTDNDVVAIEGNHHPDPDVLQAHGPLLVDEKIKQFYKFYKILS